MIRRLGLASLLLLGTLAWTRPAEASVSIRIDLASQSMEVSSAEGTYVWPISTARSGFKTPRGVFRVRRMEAMHRSHKYHNSPMPHSLFFTGGYAIHGTYDTARLGSPASHGCVRIAPENAAALYQMVANEGGARISITGGQPNPTMVASRRTRYANPDRYQEAPVAQPSDDDQPDEALGYMPRRDMSLQHWWMDPAGW